MRAWRGRFVAALAVALAAAPVRSGASQPRVVPEGTIVDFGTVERGTPVEHVFRLPNRGDATLRIEHVKRSCACTAAVLSAPEVAPGDEARVAVTLDTAGLAGATTKVVTVRTNDPERPVIGLTLKGTVAADLVVTPSPLYLGRLRRGEAVRRELAVVPGRPDGSHAVTAVEHDHPALSARLEPRADGPGHLIVVELGRDVPLGRFGDELRLRTTSPRAPVLTVAVFGSVEGDVLVVPPQVTFGVTGRGEAPERELSIRGRGARPLSVTGVAVPDEVTYALEAVEEGREYRLRLRLREGLGRRKLESAVEIFTNYPDEERLVVPLYAIIRGGRRS